MSYSILLLTSIDSPAPFDHELICASVNDLCGVDNCEEGGEIMFNHNLLLDCRYSKSNDATNISVSKDLMWVSIEGTRDVSLAAAISIQRNYGRRIYAVLGDSPELNADLTTIGSVDELRRILEL